MWAIVSPSLLALSIQRQIGYLNTAFHSLFRPAAASGWPDPKVTEVGDAILRHTNGVSYLVGRQLEVLCNPRSIFTFF